MGFNFGKRPSSDIRDSRAVGCVIEGCRQERLIFKRSSVSFLAVPEKEH